MNNRRRGACCPAGIFVLAILVCTGILFPQAGLAAVNASAGSGDVSGFDAPMVQETAPGQNTLEPSQPLVAEDNPAGTPSCGTNANAPDETPQVSPSDGTGEESTPDSSGSNPGEAETVPGPPAEDETGNIPEQAEEQQTPPDEEPDETLDDDLDEPEAANAPLAMQAAADATIDLSETVANSTDYTVGAGMNPYSVQYPPASYPNGGNTVSGSPRTLTFTASANGKSYQIVQSGRRASPPSADAPKRGTSIFNLIVVPSGVNVTLILDDIDLSGRIRLDGTATASLLLANTGLYGSCPASNIREGGIIVSWQAALVINSAAGSGNTAGALIVNNNTMYHAAIGGTNGRPNKITIEGGTITAVTTGGNSAAIGGGTGGTGGTIIINGGSVTALVNGSNGAAIGGGDNQHGGNITINGGSVTAVVNPGGGAAIGGGVMGAGGSITINGGDVTARGHERAAAIGGGGQQNSNSSGSGGNIKITGGRVLAVGGNAQYMGHAAGGPAIGPGYGGASGTIHIDSTADVVAYSDGGMPAIAQANKVNLGNGYFVNARFITPPLPSAPMALDVYANGNTKTRNLTLPQNYQSFAYTTGSTAAQNDQIFATNANNSAYLGQVLRNSDDSPQIYSLVQSALAVKLGAGNMGAGTPSIANVGGTAADFISTGHNMNTGQFVSGGFYYGTSAETGSDGKLLNATWLPWSTQNAASPKTEPVSGLTPNTLYYMQTSLTLSSGGSQTSYCSTPIPFVTAPDITQASVSTGTAGGEALVSASFHGGNAPLTAVKIYYDTAPINAGSPASWAAHTCVPLPETSFDSSGFTNFTLAGLVPGQAYNILVVAENDSLTADSGGPILGRDTWALAYRAAYAVTEKHVDVYGNPLNPAVADTQTLVPPLGVYSKLIPAVQGYAVRGYYWGSAFTPPGCPYTPGGAVAADSVESNLTVYFIYGHVANVTLSNTVTGDYADKTKSFSFMLCFTNADGSPLPAGTVFGYTGGVLGNAGATAPPNGSVTLDVGGTALLALKDGQTIALKDIPAEYKIRIVETADSNYTVSFTDSAEGLSTPGNDTGLRTMGAQARSFDFVNTRLQVVPSGLAQGGEGPVALLLLAALALLLCLAVVWLVRRRSWTK